jgi:hypothetical protein
MRTRLGAIIGAALLAGACASSPARSAVKVPLEIPEPPPRVAMDPVPAVFDETPPAVVEKPAAPAKPPASTSGNSSPAPAAGGAYGAAPPPPTAAVEPPRATPPPELRPAGGRGNGRTPSAPQVRERLVSTKKKLDSIDRRRLNAGKRVDYDSARRFLTQAEAAVKENNLLLAESSVEKAETLADGLR